MANYSFEEQKAITKQMADKIYNDSYTTTEDELVKDTNWIEASKDVYKELEGVEWSGSDEDLAKKGLEMMSRFNYNLTLGTINYTAQLQDANDKTKLSFYYMMDMYDKKDISANGVLRAFKEMGLDPASYIGIGTLGMGFVGKEAAAQSAKFGLKQMLKQGAIKFLQSPTAVGATEAAIYTSADDFARQQAAIGAGVQDEYSPGQTAVAGAVGATVGAGFVQGAKVVGKGISKAITAGEEEMAKMAGGGTPPKMGILERQAAEKAASEKPAGKEIYNPRVDKTYILGEDGNVYWESRRGWRRSEQFGLKQELTDIDKMGADKYMQMKDQEAKDFEAAIIAEEQKQNQPDSWKDQHTAPTRDQDNTTSIDDLTKIYPEDVYSSNAANYYGHGDPSMDRTAINILQRIKGKPNATITIYRAVPKDLDVSINKGDWVTISKRYAMDHGENRFDGKYKILSKDVKAKDIITDGNSIHEQGYDPKGAKQ